MPYTSGQKSVNWEDEVVELEGIANVDGFSDDYDGDYKSQPQSLRILASLQMFHSWKYWRRCRYQGLAEGWDIPSPHIW